VAVSEGPESVSGLFVVVSSSDSSSLASGVCLGDRRTAQSFARLRLQSALSPLAREVGSAPTSGGSLQIIDTDPPLSVLPVGGVRSARANALAWKAALSPMSALPLLRQMIGCSYSQAHLGAQTGNCG
jgi:hypothetical protein